MTRKENREGRKFQKIEAIWLLGNQDEGTEGGNLTPSPADMFYKTQLNADPRWRMQRRWPLLCQMCTSVTAVICLLTVLIMYIRILSSPQYPQTTSLWTTQGRVTRLETPPEAILKKNLVNFHKFSFSINNRHICDVDKIYFIIVVHSKPDHFLQRHIIRNTWGSINDIDGWKVRTVFILGKVPNEPSFPDFRQSPSSIKESRVYKKYTRRGLWTKEQLQSLIDEEARTYEDILQGDFVDRYHNLTYKHMMTYQWVLNHCRNARYMLKADDDAWMDIHQIWKYLDNTFPRTDPAPRALICKVFPSGTSPLREGKWEVSLSEYPWEGYPTYCGGLAYLAPPSVVEDLYRVSSNTHFVWVDDVYATGMLPSSSNASVRHHFMNLRYTYNDEELLQWLKEEENIPAPFYVFHTNASNRHWPEYMVKAWKKVEKQIRLNKNIS